MTLERGRVKCDCKGLEIYTSGPQPGQISSGKDTGHLQTSQVSQPGMLLSFVGKGQDVKYSMALETPSAHPPLHIPMELSHPQSCFQGEGGRGQCPGPAQVRQ